MKKVRGIIFDLDGTLVSLPIDWRRVINHVSDLLGIKVRSLLDLYPRLWGTEKYDVVSRAIEEFELASLDGLEFLDDSPRLLMRLSSEYELGLITFQGVNVTRKIIKRMGIEGLHIVTRDDSPTRIEQIARIVSAARLGFGDFLVVGDMLNDVYSAIKAGCRAVLVDRRGKYSPEGFDVIYNLNELLDLLMTENQSPE
jgi:HAD superfamily hydrolase (TIGR01549 family)